MLHTNTRRTLPRAARASALLPALLAALLLALALAGCSSDAADVTAPQDTILFWHDWQGQDATVLESMIGKYGEFNPGQTVVEKAKAPGTMYRDFVARYHEGIEPNLVLADAPVAQELIRGGYVRELTSLGVEPAQYLDSALSMVRDGDKLYGIPFTVSTQLMFYNKDRVPDAPQTLQELTQLVATPGIELGLNTNFQDAFWGIRAFGGHPYDAQGNLVIDRGAFTNWLDVLKNTQAAAGFVLSDDQTQLRNAFLNGELELYIGSAHEVNQLREKLGDKLGVSRIPVSTTGNPAGPLMQGAFLLISNNTDQYEAERALELARYLTNTQQQGAFTQGNVGRLPANRNVRITPSMPAIVVELSKQLRSATPITLSQRPVWDALAAKSQALYRTVLEGVVDVHGGVDALEQSFAQITGRSVEQTQTNGITCPTLTSSEPLTLTLWHGWSVPETTVLQQMAGEFHQACPQINIVTDLVPDNYELNNRYKEAIAAGGGPDILLDSTQWTTKLAQAGQIRTLNDLIDPARLTQFVASTISSLRYNGQLYGYPVSARSIALIYNPKLAPDPPQTLDDLLLAVDHDHQFAMPLSFFYDAWGMGAFGTRVFDAKGKAVLDQGGMAGWLQWLHDTADRPGFVFTDGRKPAEELFAQRKAAYLVSGPWSLQRLRQSLPDDEIAVTMLPSGPQNLANPLLEVESFMFNPKASLDKVKAGLAFAEYVTSVPGAERLLATGVNVPANVIVDTTKNRQIDGFRQQAQSAEPAHQGAEWDVVLGKDGDALYKDTVLGDHDPVAAVAEFTKLVNAANAGLRPAATATPVAAATPPVTATVAATSPVTIK